MDTIEQLTQVFYDNFMAYFKSHVSHVNITGRNFVSDHELLNGIYDSLQDQIDMIGELLRSLDAFMPTSIKEITENSVINDEAVEGDSEELISGVLLDLEILKEAHQNLIRIANEEGYDEISNYAQDRVLALAKQIWMIKSTLD